MTNKIVVVLRSSRSLLRRIAALDKRLFGLNCDRIYVRKAIQLRHYIVFRDKLGHRTEVERRRMEEIKALTRLRTRSQSQIFNLTKDLFRHALILRSKRTLWYSWHAIIRCEIDANKLLSLTHSFTFFALNFPHVLVMITNEREMKVFLLLSCPETMK